MPHTAHTPDSPARLPEDRDNRRWAAAFAVIAAAIVAVALWPWGWDVDVVEGSHPCWGPCGVDAGETFSQEPGDVWRVDIGSVGTATLSRGARLTRADVEEGVTVRLDAGRMVVESTARGRELVIETPAGKVVDLGCAFTVEASETETRVHVERGYVALETVRGTTVVGAGSAAVAQLGELPALPLRDDAPATFREGAARFPQGELAPLLTAARPADTFTLWHALQRADPEDRAAILSALERLVPGSVPADHTRLESLRLGALQSLWAALAPAAYREE
nr:hypothetical protein LBMAG42_32150 [Deltaproteobacteria bacterium]